MTVQNTGPLLKPLQLPFSAIPFDNLSPDQHLPALRQSVENARSEIEKIKSNFEKATFENTVVALETAVDDFRIVTSTYFGLLHAETNQSLQAISQEFSSICAEFSTTINLDSALFDRVKSVYNRRKEFDLNPEQQMLLEKTYRSFVRNGALLGVSERERLKIIDQELARLAPKFGENLLNATTRYHYLISSESDLVGLPQSVRSLLADRAKTLNLTGWAVTLDTPTYLPFMTYSENRKAREIVWKAFSSRCVSGDLDNQKLVVQTAQLRGERAHLLGYKSHAHYVLEERMAETPERVHLFLEELLSAAKPKALLEIRQLEKTLQDVHPSTTIQPWDIALLSEKMKQQIFGLNQEELRSYFELDRVLGTLFWLSEKLYHLSFQEHFDLPKYHNDVRVFEVFDQRAQKHMGLLYFDFFPRPTKRQGGWCGTWVEQGLFRGVIARPLVTVVTNFTRPTNDSPSLLTFDEASTLFHEFGHALHNLLSACTYPSVGGTNVYWDFVELPSQFMENWLLEDEVIDRIAIHYKTLEKLSKEKLRQLKESSTFMAGYSYLRQINFCLLDLAWHSEQFTKSSKASLDLISFENQATASTRILPVIEGTSSSCSFSHVFAGGYSAGYYSYKWAEILEADAFEAFKTEGLFNPKTAENFRHHILSQGGTQHPMILYKNFRGREPDTQALLRRDGLVDLSQQPSTGGAVDL